MGYTDKMEFYFEGEAANFTTGEKLKLFDGKSPILTVRPGVNNEIFMWLNASHSDVMGPNPDPEKNNDDSLVKYPSGVPYVTTYEFTWTVEANEAGGISTIGNPKKATIPTSVLRHIISDVDLEFDKSNAKYLAINIELSYNRFVQYTSGKKQFLCKLVAEKPKEAAKPKIRKESITVGSFAFGDSTIKKIKSQGKMLDYSKLSTWYNKLPERTRKAIVDGNKPGGEKIVLTGYTDNVGDEHQNFKLGTERAVAVAEALEHISGVKWGSFIATPSKGEQDVRKEEKNLEKKEPAHRRVEVTYYVEE